MDSNRSTIMSQGRIFVFCGDIVLTEIDDFLVMTYLAQRYRVNVFFHCASCCFLLLPAGTCDYVPPLYSNTIDNLALESCGIAENVTVTFNKIFRE